MTAVSGKSVLDVFARGRFRKAGIVVFVLGLLALAQAGEWFVVRYYERDWEEVGSERSAEYLAAATDAFITIQRGTRRIATEVARHPDVTTYLTHPEQSSASLFEFVGWMSREQKVGVEVYDRRGQLRAWEGLSGPRHAREIAIALEGQLTSFVTRSSVFSQLFVATPVRSEGKIIGVVLVRRMVEVNFPLNNRFIPRRGLGDRLSQDIGVNVEFDFSPEAAVRKDGRYLSLPLYGIDSARVGVVSVSRPAKTAYLEGVLAFFDKLNAGLLALLAVSVVALLIPLVCRLRTVLLKALAMTALIWLFRYVLLWLEVPSAYFTTGLFDPTSFASMFGGGLARSIGELFITSLTLFVNCVYIMVIVLADLKGRSPWWYPGNVVVRVVLALGATAFIFLLLRGYGAFLRSAVFDSTLSYGDPKVIIPSFELGMMVLSMFVVSFCLIVVCVAMTSFILTLLQRPAGGELGAWLALGGLFGLASVLFGVLQENPLMNTPYRLLFGTGIFAFAFYLHRRARLLAPILTLMNFLIALGISAVFLYPLLDDMVHDKDRRRVQTYAAEVVRPVDSWLTFVVREGLESFVNEETAEMLVRDDAENIGRLAFARWAQSLACREGYSSAFAVYDARGTRLSEFLLGSQGILRMQLDSVKSYSETSDVYVADVGSGVNAVKVYGGTIAIPTMEGDTVGYAAVVVTAGQQTLFRGETPKILRSISQEGTEGFGRPVTFSEFRNGRLFTTNNPDLPLDYILPDQVLSALNRTPSNPVWHTEHLEGKSYDTYYLRRPGEEEIVVGVSLQELGLMWHLLGIVKMMVYYAIVVLLAVAAFFLVKWAGRERLELSFRTKLLIALLITAMVPMLIFGSLGRFIARERLMENAAKRLQDETGSVAANLKQRVKERTGGEELHLTAARAEHLATELDTDFNLYAGDSLIISSRPELYEAGLLDRRLSGLAYSNIMMQKKRFFVQTEQIGLYPYTVGYRPVIDETGGIVGVVSVPTLYKQDELDEAVARQNAIIFGIYGLVFFAILLIASTVSGRIAAPIHRLTEATKRVSRGDLDVQIQSPAADGEIGELISSFGRMTQALKESRDELVRYERDQAWKEMAKQVAHEIKNPLTPMKLSIQHLRQTYKDKVPDLDRVFDQVSRTIIDQIDALSRIASEFSHFAQLPRRQLEICDVGGVLKESTVLFEQNTQVVFDVSIAADPPIVNADREELRRAFINILRNGIQAMDNKGLMELSVRVETPFVVAMFTDHGEGMTDEVKEKLFEPNFSTKTDGMGLGLAIVKKTIDELGGTIGVESRTGEGTTVTIRLPLATKEVQ